MRVGVGVWLGIRVIVGVRVGLRVPLGSGDGVMDGVLTIVDELVRVAVDDGSIAGGGANTTGYATSNTKSAKIKIKMMTRLVSK